MADLNGEMIGSKASPECKKIKDCARRDYQGLNDIGALKILFSPSRLSGEQAFESADSDSRHGSTLAFENNSSKCHEADMQSSSVRVGSTQVKSEISTETHLSQNRSLEMDMKKKQRNRVIGGEDGLSTNMTARDSQHQTESSCSNSLPVVVPVSLSYQSYQESSKEAYLFRNCGSSMDSSNSKAFDRSPEEPVTASSESGMSAQIASKARRNVNARNSMKILSLGGNHSLSMITKRERETSRSWDIEAATPEDGEVLKERDDVKCDSRERMVKHEMSGEGGSVVATEGKSLETGSEVMDKHKDEFWVNESADSSMAKNSKKSVKDEEKIIAGFDLNEDLNANEPDDYVQPVSASVSSHSVIHVVAKAGIPNGQPMIPLKFEGDLGWKGTAQTSAFRSTSLSKNLDGKAAYSTNHGPKDHEGFAGIDLNVAAVEDIAAYGIPIKGEAVSSHSALQEVDRKQDKSPWIDLNCLYDAAEESTQPSIQPKSENAPLVDLNLDSSSSFTERPSNVHWLGQASQFLGNKKPDFPNPGTRDFSFNRNVYLADLSTIQHMANNGHTLMASPQFLQQMELVPRVASHALPPHGTMPYSRFFHEHGIFPEVVNPSSVHSLYIPPHPGQFVHEQSSSSNITAFLPKVEARTKDLLSASGSKGDGPRFFPFLSKESPMGERMHQEAWYAASLKRKEPEGGLDCFQLGYKQLT